MLKCHCPGISGWLVVESVCDTNNMWQPLKPFLVSARSISKPSGPGNVTWRQANRRCILDLRHTWSTLFSITHTYIRMLYKTIKTSQQKCSCRYVVQSSIYFLFLSMILHYTMLPGIFPALALILGKFFPIKSDGLDNNSLLIEMCSPVHLSFGQILLQPQRCILKKPRRPSPSTSQIIPPMYTFTSHLLLIPGSPLELALIWLDP